MTLTNHKYTVEIEKHVIYPLFKNRICIYIAVLKFRYGSSNLYMFLVIIASVRFVQAVGDELERASSTELPSFTHDMTFIGRKELSISRC